MTENWGSEQGGRVLRLGSNFFTNAGVGTAGVFVEISKREKGSVRGGIDVAEKKEIGSGEILPGVGGVVGALGDRSRESKVTHVDRALADGELGEGTVADADASDQNIFVEEMVREVEFGNKVGVNDS